jgi:hypothetical protein
MNIHSHTQRILGAGTATGLLVLSTLVLAPTQAQASRPPADPVTFVAAPTAAVPSAGDSHTASIRSTLADLHAGDAVADGC